MTMTGQLTLPYVPAVDLFVSARDLPDEEALFHALRVARADDRIAGSGALLSCSLIVVDASGHHRPVDLPDHTPGQWLRKGVHQIAWTAAGATWEAAGTVTVVVGADPWSAPPSVASVVGDGGPVLGPDRIVLPATDPAELRMQRRRTRRACDQVLMNGLWADPSVRATVRKVQSAAVGRTHVAFDADDARAVVKAKIVEGASLFAGPARPLCTWTQWLTGNVLREPVREARRRRPESGSVARQELAALIRGRELAHLPVGEIRRRLAELGASPTEARIEDALATPTKIVSLAAPAGDKGELGDTLAQPDDERGDLWTQFTAWAGDHGFDAGQLWSWLDRMTRGSVDVGVAPDGTSVPLTTTAARAITTRLRDALGDQPTPELARDLLRAVGYGPERLRR